MAKLVLTNVITTIGGVDYSANINQVEINVSADSVETTSFGGSNGWRTEVSGLKSGTFTVAFHNDYAAAAIDGSLWSLFGTLATVVVKPNGTAVGTANPSYTFVANVNNLTPIAGSVGDLATQNVTWPITGEVARATA
jgi:predicted secreted protein